MELGLEIGVTIKVKLGKNLNLQDLCIKFLLSEIFFILSENRLNIISFYLYCNYYL